MDDRTRADPARSRMLHDFVARLAASRPDSNDRLDAATAELFRSFATEGVAALLLKGPALARTLYQRGERRSYVDVDVLVEPSHRDTARRTLARLGYINTSAPLGIDDIGGVVHAETWIGTPRGTFSGVVVELHLWLAGATASPESAWRALSSSRSSIELAGVEVPTLGRAGLALNLATHAAQHGSAYTKGLMELGMALERWPIEVWADAAALATGIEATGAFAGGLRLLPAGAKLAATLDLPASPRTDWEIANLDSRPRGTFHLRAFVDAPGATGRLNVARRALLPKREWMVDQHRWAERGGPAIVAAYLIHIIRAPGWALRAWQFRRREPR